jgi:aminoglycoside phosphotransferase (APT) family kinase protein
MNTPLPDQPAEVRPGEELDHAVLSALLNALLPEDAGPLSVRQFPGGASNLTYLLRWGQRELVLRRPPFGAQVRGGHDMGREYRILRALAPVYPHVPTALAYYDDERLLGAPFYLMERVPGVILRAPLSPAHTPPPAELRRICHALVDGLADLHAIDVQSSGLAELGKPEGYTARQVAGWAKRYHASRTEDSPDGAAISAWLEANLPAESAASLIHNDYKYDNLVLDPADLARIVAVLDWEMATIGDPLTDLGTSLAYWVEPDDPPALRLLGITALPGNLDRQGVIERYAARSGRDLSAIVFYYVYGLFKNLVIVQQIYARYRQGHTRDPRFAQFIAIAHALAHMAERAITHGTVSGRTS